MENENSSIEPDIAAMTDRELLEEMYRFMSNVNDMLLHVQPALDGIAKSPVGKMLGIK